MQVCALAHVCTGPRLIWNVFLYRSSTVFFEAGSLPSVNLRIPTSAKHDLSVVRGENRLL